MHITYGKHHLDEKDIQAVIKVLKSSNLTQGITVKNFEKELKKYFGFNHCSVLSNGTAALHLAIKSLNLKNNEKILTSPLTFVSTASSILMNNLLPEFVDIDAKDYTIDLDKTEDALKKNKNIKAIIGVDYAGHPCDWKSLNYLKKKYRIWLINDNCHAMGSKIDGSLKYTSKYCDIVTQSYHPVKSFTTGEGGSILTNIYDINEKIQKFRNHCMVKNSKISKRFGIWRYQVDNIGYNYRLTDIQSALGISQLKKLKKFIKKRREIASFYDQEFKKNEFLSIPKVKKGFSHSYHLYPLLIDFKSLKLDKKIFFKEMLKKKLKLQVHYTPLYKQKFLKDLKFRSKNFPVTEKFYEKEVSIPIFYNLGKSTQKKIIFSINKYLNKYVK